MSPPAQRHVLWDSSCYPSLQALLHWYQVQGTRAREREKAWSWSCCCLKTLPQDRQSTRWRDLLLSLGHSDSLETVSLLYYRCQAISALAGSPPQLTSALTRPPTGGDSGSAYRVKQSRQNGDHRKVRRERGVLLTVHHDGRRASSTCLSFFICAPNHYAG